MSAQLDQIMAQAANDPDVIETQEWLDALEAVIENEGPIRAQPWSPFIAGNDKKPDYAVKSN